MKIEMLISALLAGANAADTCKALILSGGGAKGAWEAGVYYGFLHNGNPDDFAYDVLSGVSAGSTNTALLLNFAAGDDMNASEFLSDVWLNLKTSDYYQNWTGSYLTGLTIKSGIYNNQPARDFLKSTTAQFSEWKRPAFFGTIDVDSGAYLVWGQDNIDYSDVADAAVASGSAPFIFPPASFKGHTLMDGGTVYNLNISSAVEECRHQGFDDSKIIVDILNCNTISIATEEDVGHSINNYLRSRTIKSSNKAENDVYEMMRAYPDVDFRYVIGMEMEVSSLSELNFDGEHTWAMQTSGRQQAIDALAAGPGTTARKIREIFQKNDNDNFLQK